MTSMVVIIDIYFCQLLAFRYIPEFINQSSVKVLSKQNENELFKI